jgi:hypothetical protein
MPATMTIQGDPFIAPCALLALPTQCRRAEPQQDSFSTVELGSVVVAQGAVYCSNGLDRQGHEGVI